MTETTTINKNNNNSKRELKGESRLQESGKYRLAEFSEDMGKILNHRNEENIKENKEKTLQKTDFRDRNKQMKRCQDQRGKLVMMWDTAVISVWSSESFSDPHTESRASLG